MAQVQFLSFLQRSRMRAEMAMEEAARKEAAADGPGADEDAKESFYQLLADSKDLLPDNSWWV